MKRLLYLPILLAAAVFVIAGCSSDSSTPADTPPNSTFVGASGNTVDIDGFWDFACSTDGSGGSDQGTDSFTGATFSNTEQGYFGMDTTCASATTFYTEVFAGTLNVVGTTTTADFGGAPVTANQVTVTVTSVQTTPNDDAAATIMNTNMEYGLTNWAGGVTQDVLALLVGFIGSNSFNILLYVDDISVPNLLYDDDTDPPMIAGFPTVIDNTGFSTRR